MTFIAKNTEKACFKACEKRMVDEGQCDCVNRSGFRFKGNEDISDVIDSVCDHCNGTGWDSYPNHSTTFPPCPKCQF